MNLIPPTIYFYELVTYKLNKSREKDIVLNMDMHPHLKAQAFKLYIKTSPSCASMLGSLETICKDAHMLQRASRSLMLNKHALNRG